MPDPLLRSRVIALRRQLDLVAESRKWLGAMQLQSGEVAAELGTELERTIGKLARKKIDALEAIVTELDADEESETDLAEQWRAYQRVQDSSDEVFSECLEFFGGLAIRKNRWDDQICQVADELIRTCARESTGAEWISCTVPAPHEALAKTLARMVRLRFPDWSVWTLPFTAHEYGHVALVETEELRDFVADEVLSSVMLALPDIVSVRASAIARERGADDQARIYEDLEALAHEKVAICMREAPETLDDVLINGSTSPIAGQPEPETERSLSLRVRQTVRRERIRMQVLIADAFATYTMGPAYACAALLLRFSPARRDEAVWDTERAAVILAMLRRLPGNYDEVISLLDRQWDRSVGRARAPARLEPAAVKSVDALVTAAWRVFRLELLNSALYPESSESEGWLDAQKLTAQWREDLAARRESLTSGNARVTTLRDVLNAAWLCRLKVYQDADRGALDRADSIEEATQKIDKAAVAVCKSIALRRAPTLTDVSSQGPHE